MNYEYVLLIAMVTRTRARAHTHIYIFPVGNSLFSSCVEEWDTVSHYYSIIVGYIVMLVSNASCAFFDLLCTPCVVGYLVWYADARRAFGALMGEGTHLLILQCGVSNKG
jgi:hypothetical protein